MTHGHLSTVTGPRLMLVGSLLDPAGRQPDNVLRLRALTARCQWVTTYSLPGSRHGCMFASRSGFMIKLEFDWLSQMLDTLEGLEQRNL